MRLILDVSRNWTNPFAGCEFNSLCFVSVLRNEFYCTFITKKGWNIICKIVQFFLYLKYVTWKGVFKQYYVSNFVKYVINIYNKFIIKFNFIEIFLRCKIKINDSEQFQYLTKLFQLNICTYILHTYTVKFLWIPVANNLRKAACDGFLMSKRSAGFAVYIFHLKIRINTIVKTVMMEKNEEA